jgi:hypothetical protein
MNLSEEQIQIIQGKICPYCKSPSALINSIEVYGKDFGLMYICKPCEAYVGCHKGTENALGRLANPDLRKWKIEAHKYFDMLWKKEFMTRTEAYKWLSEWLEIPAEYTHIGMFDIKTLKKVIEYSKQRMNDERRLDLDFGVEPKTEYFEQ